MKLKITLLLILFTFSSLAMSASFNPTMEEIAHLAKQTVKEKMGTPADAKVDIIIQRFDKRFVLPKCTAPVVAKLTGAKIRRHNTVKLSCERANQDFPWQVYLSVNITVSYQVVVASKTIMGGERIGTSNTSLEFIDETSLRGGQFQSLNDVIGTRLKRRSMKGSAILKQNICYVCKGDDVAIFAKSKNLHIKTSGEALKDGNLQDLIRVKNLNSNKIIEARVIGIGEVEVRM
ncbi:MAG: flagellar basal body P-ring formation protein FlgA [Shewanella sp.]|nr:flagellar basal body P-ring formation protein FlgA [Shewanella sp.]